MESQKEQALHPLLLPLSVNISPSSTRSGERGSKPMLTAIRSAVLKPMPTISHRR